MPDRNAIISIIINDSQVIFLHNYTSDHYDWYIKGRMTPLSYFQRMTHPWILTHILTAPRNGICSSRPSTGIETILNGMIAPTLVRQIERIWDNKPHSSPSTYNTTRTITYVYLMGYMVLGTYISIPLIPPLLSHSKARMQTCFWWLIQRDIVICRFMLCILAGTFEVLIYSLLQFQPEPHELGPCILRLGNNSRLPG